MTAEWLELATNCSTKSGAWPNEDLPVRTADIARAKDLVTQSLTISPRSTLAHYVNAHILRAEGRCGEAIPEYEMVIASNRNFAGALADRRSGTCVNSERIPVDPPR